MASWHQFVQLGDPHFGPGPRNADRYRALDQILADGESVPDLAAWLWPGDFVAGIRVPLAVADTNALSDRLVRMADRAPVVLTYGNHDLSGDLEIFGKLRAAYPVYVVDRPSVLSVRLATGALAAIAVLPYPTRAGLIAAGTGASQTLETGSEALLAVVRGLAAGLEVARARGELTLTIGHLNVSGALASVGQPQVGREIDLDPAMLALLTPFGYVGLNHIHKPQEIHGAHFAGSITPNDWGEMEAKRYLVIGVSDDPELRPAVESRPIAVPAMYHVEGDLTRDGFAWRVTKGLGGEVVEGDWTCPQCGGSGDGIHDPVEGTLSCVACGGSGDRFHGADVRVRYSYRPAERDVLEEAIVRAPFEGARNLKVEAVPILDAAIRAPEVAAAATVEDQVRAYCREQGIAITEGLLAKLAAVQAERQDHELAGVGR